MSLWKIFTRTAFVLLTGFCFALFAGALAVSLYFKVFAVGTGFPSEKLVQIPFGSSLRRVSTILHDTGVIKDANKFYWYLRLGRSDGEKIQAGLYQFTGINSHQEIADRLLSGKDQSFRITFREGETLADLARLLENAGLLTSQEFLAAITGDDIVKLFDLPSATKRKDLLKDVSGLEGYLFPDTYFFSKSDTALGIVKKMHLRLLEVIRDEMMPMAGLRDFLHQTLTLASIVEKETGDPSERPRIASVYHNRLRSGMRLQADPTVIYGIRDYDGKIAKTDLETFHPYNTYKIRGLPPGPIAAPGLFSIRAALKPEDTKYLYFVSRNDGTHVFCENLSCHNKAVQKWQIDYFKNRRQ